MRPVRRRAVAGAVLGMLLFAGRAQAEPYIAVQQGLKCAVCHVNATGGGMRTVFGDLFAQNNLPARKIDTGPDNWVGQVGSFLRAGGDLRFDAQLQQAPHTRSVQEFSLEQTRIYLAASVIPDRLLVYVDEQVAPGGTLNREAYGMLWSANHEWYVKAGQMYLPFGFRLQDQTAFILTASGINMSTPDQGVEVGWLHGPWEAQLAASNGTAGGPVNSTGKQFSSQLIYVEPRWRLGVAANSNDQSVGHKNAWAVFGGLRTGPIGWLGQAEIIDDQSIANDQGRMLATLIEADWLIARGHNLKITDEFLNPNREAGHGEQTRWSVVYELTPIQFLQVRAGFRYADGIPQDNAQHGRLYFVELHGFF
jgi:hypothetical protein